MGINQKTAVTGYIVKNLVYVLDDNLVIWIGNGSGSVALLLQLRLLMTLVGNENDLIIDYGLGIGDMVDTAQEVFGHHCVVYGDISIGPEQAGKTDIINVQQTENLHPMVAHADHLVVDLEVGHGEITMDKIHRIITLTIVSAFIGLQPVTYYLVILEPVHDLLTFDKEVLPLSGIIGMQAA